MRNVRVSQLRSCIVLEPEEYDYILTQIYPDAEISTEYTLEGISVDIDGSDPDTDDLHGRLAKHFDVEKVTSVHMDDCENIGVWIVYEI